MWIINYRKILFIFKTFFSKYFTNKSQLPGLTVLVITIIWFVFLLILKLRDILFNDSKIKELEKEPSLLLGVGKTKNDIFVLEIKLLIFFSIKTFFLYFLI